MKIYKSFEQIDRDLQILNLQAKIEREEIRASVSKIKEDFSPVSMVASFVGSLTKKAILFKTVASIFNMGKK